MLRLCAESASAARRMERCESHDDPRARHLLWEQSSALNRLECARSALKSAGRQLAAVGDFEPAKYPVGRKKARAAWNTRRCSDRRWNGDAPERREAARAEGARRLAEWKRELAAAEVVQVEGERAGTAALLVVRGEPVVIWAFDCYSGVFDLWKPLAELAASATEVRAKQLFLAAADAVKVTGGPSVGPGAARASPMAATAYIIRSPVAALPPGIVVRLRVPFGADRRLRPLLRGASQTFTQWMSAVLASGWNARLWNGNRVHGAPILLAEPDLRLSIEDAYGADEPDGPDYGWVVELEAGAAFLRAEVLPCRSMSGAAGRFGLPRLFAGWGRQRPPYKRAPPDGRWRIVYGYSPLLALPAPLLRAVVEMLPPADQRRAALACRRLSEVVDELRPQTLARCGALARAALQCTLARADAPPVWLHGVEVAALHGENAVVMEDSFAVRMFRPGSRYRCFEGGRLCREHPDEDGRCGCGGIRRKRGRVEMCSCGIWADPAAARRLVSRLAGPEPRAAAAAAAGAI